MRAIKTGRLFLLAVICAAAGRSQEQGTPFGFQSIGFKNGVTAKITVAVEPPAPVGAFVGQSFGVSTTNGQVFHRVIIDDSKRAYFGYDISTERLPNSNRIRVIFEPLSLPADQPETRSNAKDLKNFRLLVLPRYPPPQIVEEGDKIVLDLLISADGKQKIVDYIEIVTKKKS